MSKKIENQKIKGNNNIQVGGSFHGDVIKTNKIINKTIIKHSEDKHITDSQAKQILDRIQEIGKSMSQKESITNRTAYSREHIAFKNKFKITSYKLLPKEKFEEAIKWLQQRMRYTGHKVDRRANKPAARNRNYRGIYTRGRQLGMSKEDIFFFAKQSLNLKTSINSLSELSDTRLEKLYQKIFSKKL